MDLSFIGDVVSNIDDVVLAFDKEGQQNQIALAQANARIAEANASGTKAPSRNNALLIGGIAFGLIVVAVLIFKSKKK